MLFAFGASRAFAFASNLLLARLLSPAEFGLVSFAMVMIGALTLLQDFGVPAAIVYGGRDARTVAGTALTINVVAASALFGVAMVVAPAVAASGGDPSIAPIARTLALGLVIASIGSVQSAFLVKELAFKRKFLPDVVPTVASGVVSIALALLGYGVWSLVFGYLARTAASTILLWCLTSIRPLPEFRRAVAGELLRYGRHVSLSSTAGFIAMNVDYLIIGHFLGKVELGIYTLAFVMSNLLATSLGSVFYPVMFAAYCRVREHKSQIHGLFLDAGALVLYASIVTTIVLYAAAPALPLLLLGEKWAAIVTPLRLLLAVGLLRCVEQLFVPAYRAVGRPDMIWRYNTARLAALVPLMLFGVRFGIAGIAASHALVGFAVVVGSLLQLARIIELPLHRVKSLFQPHLCGGAAAVLVAAIIQAYFGTGGDGADRFGSLSQLGLAAVTGGLALIAYVSIALLLEDRPLARVGAALEAYRAPAPRTQQVAVE